jgi:hypothetical protein
MTHLYVVYNPWPELALAAWDWVTKPLNVLVAMPFLKEWDKFCAKNPQVAPARTMLDSGAYTAWRTGAPVDMADLIERSKDPRWTETVGLDVIGSGPGTRVNLDLMRAAGSPAMPVFHIGDDWGLLDHYVAHWPKIGLSCRFGEPEVDSLRFLDRCFARHWPHRYHSFGWTQRQMLLRFPFHSADSSTWAIGSMYRSVRLKGKSVQARGLARAPLTRYLETHIAEVLDLAAQLRLRWGTTLDTLP